MARTPARSPWAALALLCLGPLVGGCTAATPWPPVPPPGAGARTTPAPAPTPAAGPSFVLPTEAPPVLTLAVAGSTADPAAGPATGPPVPAPHTTTRRPAPGSAGVRGGRHPRALPAPAPKPPHRRATPCDLGEQLGRWPLGSAQDTACHAVYG
ncbi:hypothetical protein ACEZCY_23725 [Streptacidiphilus sp. N1-12]|uniref:Uncharacterized protein n=2 Tax=Streptacidiphilus alkalitolerans TaxID=3342712 RepID=A0ABV6WK98_9ACTN